MTEPSVPPTHKTCTKCRETKPIEAFRVRRRQCRACDNAYAKTNGPLYRRKNAAQIRARDRARYPARRDQQITNSQAWRRAYPEKDRARRKAYYQAHRAEMLTKAKAYQLAHRAELLAWKKRHYQAHRAELLAKTDAYHRAHPEQYRAIQKTYRARKQQAAIYDLTVQDWRDILTTYKHRCAYCGRRVKHLERDHITPVNDGGNYTKHNIVPACRSCNAKKGKGPPLIPVQPLLL